IDLELTSENGHTVQRLVAQSPANLDAVQLRVEGADEMELSSNRTSGHTIGLTVKTAMGDLTLPLFALVSPDGTPLDSSSSPTLNSNRIQAPFARHSSPNDLRLASNTSLAYSTFIGGSTYDNARSLALDSAGNAVVAGQTPSLDFPTTAGSYDMTHNGNEDMFVLKLNAAGNGLIYSTFIGSSNYDFSESLALDSAGNAVVTGTTNSDDFPTTPGSYDTTYNNTPNFFDAAKNNLIHGDFSGDTFVLKLNAAGNDLIYSTFIGGSSNDVGDSVALDSAGNAVVTGYTESENFPTTPNSYDTIHNGYGDGFTVKLNAAGSDLIYSTFIGGSLNDSSGSVALDSAGNAVVTGITESDDFPTTPGSYDTTLNNKFMLFDMFVLKLNAAGNDLIYSTFIG
ncbi:MAG: SBBP repeat-containing protein, partial [Ardenticatenaceae bacterium]